MRLAKEKNEDQALLSITILKFSALDIQILPFKPLHEPIMMTITLFLLQIQFFCQKRAEIFKIDLPQFFTETGLNDANVNRAFFNNPDSLTVDQPNLLF